MTTDGPPTSDVALTVETMVRRIGRIPPADTYFTPTTELFDSGYLESLGIVQLTACLERQFTIDLTEEDLFDERFTTVEGIASLVRERRARSNNPA